MVKNDVSFILSFVILMEKYEFSSSPLEYARWNYVVWCHLLSTLCLMEGKYSWEALN